MIDLRNFVEININYVENPELSRTRDTAVLIDMYDEDGFDKTYTSRIDTDKSELGINIIAAFSVNMFFENGGKQLHVIGCKDEDEKRIIEKIKKLSNKEIVIGFVGGAENLPEEINNKINLEVYENTNEKEFSGIKEKIIVTKHDLRTFSVPTGSKFDFETFMKNYKADNLALKHTYKIPGNESPDYMIPTDMAVLAYLTQVNIESVDTVADYNFTKESLEKQYEAYVNAGLVIDSNKDLQEIIKNNSNAICELDENALRNVGGNTTGGKDLMNHFMKIVLVQTLTDRIMSVLLKKIKYDYNGIEIVSNSIIDELNIYKNNGYLSTNKTWKGDAWVENGIKIVDKGEMLLNGYKFVIAPFSSLSDEERKAHKFPTIYLAISDAYGVRMVKIKGNVF